MKFEHLLMIVVTGVILADIVANVGGTTALFNGVNMLWGIGTQPTNTKLLSTTMANNGYNAPAKKKGP